MADELIVVVDTPAVTGPSALDDEVEVVVVDTGFLAASDVEFVLDRPAPLAPGVGLPVRLGGAAGVPTPCDAMLSITP